MQHLPRRQRTVQLWSEKQWRLPVHPPPPAVTVLPAIFVRLHRTRPHHLVRLPLLRYVPMGLLTLAHPTALLHTWRARLLTLAIARKVAKWPRPPRPTDSRRKQEKNSVRTRLHSQWLWTPPLFRWP